MIRKAVFQDEEQIAVVYEKARAYMAEHGNPNQWGRTFPPRELTHEDIEKGILYVLEEKYMAPSCLKSERIPPIT